jgi:hypothetical protein
MNKNNFCPECESPLPEKSKYCTCGWKRIKQQKSSNVDRRCQYVFEDQRCTAAGTVSESTRSNESWICMTHWLKRNDPVQAKAILKVDKNN